MKISLIYNFIKVKVPEIFLGSQKCAWPLWSQNSKIGFMSGNPETNGWYTGLGSSKVSLTLWGKGAFLALVYHLSSGGATIKIHYVVVLLH